MRENWKTIANFEAYEVSDLGRVRRRLPAEDNNNTALTGQALKPSPQGNGYLIVCLLKHKKKHTKLVHRLVAEAFLPNPLNLPQVNHKGNKIDNRAKKLEWRSIAGHRLDKMQRGQMGDGVSLHKASGKWRVSRCLAPSKRLYSKEYNTRKEAVLARQEFIASIPYVL